jgi:hypothetical protein
MDDDVDDAAEARYGLIDRIVDDLVDEVMEARGTSGPDIHGRSLTDRIEAFENLDGTGVVAHSRDIPGRDPDGVGDRSARSRL